MNAIDLQQQLFPKCIEQSLGVVARVPLGEGSLITEASFFPPSGHNAGSNCRAARQR